MDNAENINSSLGQRIRDIRNEKGLRISDLADMIGISPPALSNYERDERKPDSDVIVNLAKVFNCTTDYLLGLDVKRSKEYNEVIKGFLSELKTMYDSLAKDGVQEEFKGFLDAFKAKSKIRDEKMKLYSDSVFKAIIVSFRGLFENILDVESKETKNEKDYESNLTKDDVLNANMLKMVQGITQIVDDFIISQYTPGHNRRNTYISIDQLLNRIRTILEMQIESED